MSWVRVDDKFPRHPKVIGLCAQAAALWLAACCWCSEYETDGALPDTAVMRLSWYAAEAAKELEVAGLWVRTETGWQIHDYLKFNPSRRDKQEKRDREQARFLRTKGGKSAGSLPAETKQSAPFPCPIPHSPLEEPPIVPQGGSGFSLSAEPEKPAKKRQAMPELPPWIPPDLWEDWRAQKRALRMPMTPGAEVRQIAALERLRSEGHDVVAVMNRTLERGWKSFQPLSEGPARPVAKTPEVDILAHLRRPEEDPNA